MLTIKAFQCSICGITHADKSYIQAHEDYCIVETQYQLKRRAEQNAARAYLGTFRTRALSVSHLIELINDEMNDIVTAHNVIENYAIHKKISPLMIVSFKSHGFASAKNPEPKSMTHSAPVGMRTCPSWPPSQNQKAMAFELEFFTYQIDKTLPFDWLFTHIAGVNQGGGGNYSNKNQSVNYHHYITFWVEDWCKGFQ